MAPSPTFINLAFSPGPRNAREARVRAIQSAKLSITPEAARKLDTLATYQPDVEPDVLLAQLRANVDADSNLADQIAQTGTPQGAQTPVPGTAGTPQPAQGDQNWDDRGLFPLVKGVTRTALNTVSLPLEMIKGGIEAAAGEYGVMGADTENKGFGDGWDDYVSSLSLWQQVATWTDQGDGWFGVGNQAAVNQEAARTRNSFYVDEDGKRQANSLGRMNAQYWYEQTDWDAIAPGSDGFKILEAVSNIATDVALDPATYLTLGAAGVGKGKKIVDLLDKAGEVNKADAIDDVIRTTETLADDTQTVADWTKRNADIGDQFKAQQDALIDDLTSGRITNDEFRVKIKDITDQSFQQRAGVLREQQAAGAQLLQESEDRLRYLESLAARAKDPQLDDLVAAQRDTLNTVREQVANYRVGQQARAEARATREGVTSLEDEAVNAAFSSTAAASAGVRRAERAERSIQEVQDTVARIRTRIDVGDLAEEQITALRRVEGQLIAKAQTLTFTGKAKDIDAGIKSLRDAVLDAQTVYGLKKSDVLGAVKTAQKDATKTAAEARKAATVAGEQADSTLGDAAKFTEGLDAADDPLSFLANQIKFAKQELSAAEKAAHEQMLAADRARLDKITLRDERLKMLEDSKDLSEAVDAARRGDTALLRGVYDSLIQTNKTDIPQLLFGKQFSTTLKLLAKETSPNRIMQMSGKKLPATVARDLADATTEDEVVAALTKAIGMRKVTGPLNGYGWRASRGIYRLENEENLGRVAKAMGWSLRPSLRVYEAANNFVPWGYRLDLNDVNTVAPAYNDWLSMALARGIRGSKATRNRDEVNALVDDLVDDMVRQDSALGRRDSMFRGMKRVLEYVAKENGLDEGSEAYKALKTQLDTAVSRYSNQAGEAAHGSNYAPFASAVGAGEIGDPRIPRSLNQLSDQFQFPNVKEVRRIARQAKRYSTDGKAGEEFHKFVEFGIDKVFRTAVLAFRPAYILRNIGEMMFRMYLTGSLADPLTMMGIALNYRGRNTWLGNLFKKFDAYSEDLRGAEFAKYNDDLSSYEEEIRATMYRAHSAVDPGVMDATASQHADLIHLGEQGFEDAWFRQLNMLRSDKLFRDIAGVRYGRLTPRIEKYMADNPGLSAEDAVVGYYMRGPGKSYLNTMRSQRQEWRTWTADDAATRRLFFDDENSLLNGEINKYLLNGRDSELIDAWFYSRPGVDDKRLRKATRNATKRTYDEPDTFEFSVWHTDKDKALQQRNRLTKAVDWFFHWSAVGEGAFNFAPHTRWAYWREVENLLPNMSQADQVKVLAVAQRSLKPMAVGVNKQSRAFKRIEKIVNSDQTGDMTWDFVHETASRQAAKSTRDLFYDAQRRQQFWYALRLVFPFGQAWGNTMNTWGKLLSTPKGAARGLFLTKSYKELQGGYQYNTEEEWNAIKHDPRKRPLIFKDPMSGQMSIKIPLVGSLPGMSGVLGEQETIAPLSSFNVATGGGLPLPGFGPAITLPFITMTNLTDMEDYTPNWVDKWVQPYPSGLEKDSLGVAYDTFIPAWLKRVNAGLNPVFGDSEIAATQQYVAPYLLSRNPDRYTNAGDKITAEGEQLLAEDSARMSRLFSIYRGLVQAAFPGTLVYKWKLEDGDTGDLTQEALAYEFQQRMAETGQDYNGVVAELDERYGPGSLMAIISKTDNKGIPSTTKAGTFFQNNPAAFKYVDGVGYLFEYNAADRSADFERTLRAKNLKEPRTVEDSIARVNNQRYFIISGWLEEQVATGQLTEDQAATMKQQYADEFGVEYVATGGIGSEQKIRALRDAVNDPETNLTSLPQGLAAQQYFALRDQALASVRAQTGRPTATLDSADAAPYRQQLAAYGAQLASQVPEFGRAWNTLLRYEVEGK